MFIDAREVSQGTQVRTTVCVIGGGAAGMTIALQLNQHGVDTCLLESGGFGPDDDTRDLYRGENAGLPYAFADGHRSRFLGGSSNCWGGWCRAWDSWEFEKREWIPFSGWPFGWSQLSPYLQRVHEVLQLGPPTYDPDFFEAALSKKDVQRIPLPGGRVRDIVCQFSPPTRFGKVYRTTFEHSQCVRVYLHANVVELETDETARNVTTVHVRTLNGKTMRIAAQVVVLATGGIENARLLLASNKVQTAGLGNSADLVGRFFMDHPRLCSGNVVFNSPWNRNKFYDAKFHYQNPTVAAYGRPVAGQFSLTRETMERERLLGCHVWFSSLHPGEGTKAAEALVNIKHTLLQKGQPGRGLHQDIATLLAHPIDAMGFTFSRCFRPWNLIRGVRLQAIVEPEPNPDSRVTLSDEKDLLGMPRVRVTWKLGAAVQRTFDRTLEIVADELKKSGIADVTLDPRLEGSSWPAELVGSWHHMGTTRIHDSPQYGVVDRNCRVHSVNNLYIAGSSVFPTGGTNYPTITIVALALRLVDHLIDQLRLDSVLQTAPPIAHSYPNSIPPVPPTEDCGHIQA